MNLVHVGKMLTAYGPDSPEYLAALWQFKNPGRRLPGDMHRAYMESVRRRQAERLAAYELCGRVGRRSR